MTGQRRPRVSNAETGLGVRQAQLVQADEILRQRERDMGGLIARKRAEQMRAEGGEEYLELLDKSEFKQVCCVCRTKRTMRSHHCKECSRCVDRHDHHCPWIDNCVGLGSQRSFYCFITTLLLVILGYYYVVALYMVDEVLPGIAHGSVMGLFSELWSGSIWPLVKPLLVLMSAMFNLVWLVFVGALLLRTTAYMMVNITTSEVLIRPTYVQHRFPKKRGNFWFLKGFGLASALRHCRNYWTLNMDDDEGDFMGGPESSREEGLGSGVVDYGTEINPDDVFAGLPSPGGTDVGAMPRSTADWPPADDGDRGRRRRGAGPARTMAAAVATGKPPQSGEPPAYVLLGNVSISQPLPQV